ncbi:hypothetical protein HY440_02590 [Candidatus Microgenomates bacterium]|nr:hypothetical protein [Candidatus Microgenomates bacterium]
MNNPCVRCGKQRITLRKWKEKIKTASGISEVSYEETICPDPACQKIVEAKQKELRDKAQERADLKLKRATDSKNSQR